MISACRGKFDRFVQIEQLDYEYDVLKLRDKQEFSNDTVARSPANNPLTVGILIITHVKRKHLDARCLVCGS